VCEAQKRFAQAQLVDRAALGMAQRRADVVAAETILRTAFETDVSPILHQWRTRQGLAADPLTELRSSGIIAELGERRSAARARRGDIPAASYA
jgi:L-rhamnose isomerase/sugar isomerase